jgi:hypothetical protein
MKKIKWNQKNKTKLKNKNKIKVSKSWKIFAKKVVRLWISVPKIKVENRQLTKIKEWVSEWLKVKVVLLTAYNNKKNWLSIACWKKALW